MEGRIINIEEQRRKVLTGKGKGISLPGRGINESKVQMEATLEKLWESEKVHIIWNWREMDWAKDYADEVTSRSIMEDVGVVLKSLDSL